MIAASDPLEFVPRGRQQIARHPGPLLEPLFKSNDFDEYLQNGLEKVSLSESNLAEFWALRRAPHDGIDNKILSCEKTTNKLNSTSYNNPNKRRSTTNTESKSHHTTISQFINIEESLSFNNKNEISLLNQQQKIIGKRTSDVSVRFPNKRLSCGSSERKNESRITAALAADLNNKTQVHAADTNFGCSSYNSQLEPGFMEDELYVKGHIAVWSRGILNNSQNDNGRKIICCYTVPLPIKQALWCTFYSERPELESSIADLYGKLDEPSGTPVAAICLADSHHLRVFIIKGEQFVIPMPFYIKKVWNTKFGILIERSEETRSDQTNSGEKHPGTLFSLTHPLNDVCSVAISRNSSIRKLTSTNFKMVYSDEKFSICMLFDNITKEHSVYKVRKVRCDEKDYGDENRTHSAYNSHRLKSRLSVWENLMSSGNVVTPSPINNFKPNINNLHHKSKSFSSMATISRCQSPSITDLVNPWTTHSSKKDNMCRSVLYDETLPSKSFFNCSRAMSHLLSTPNICLEYLWTDTYSTQDTVTGTAATTVFLSEDIVGQKYLCYILPSRFQLSVVKIDFSNNCNINFGLLTSISAKDAVNISHLNMMAILEHSGNITLYSGLTMVGKLHLGGTLLQHTPSPFARRTEKVSPFPRRSSLVPLSKTEPKFDEHLLSPVLPSSAYKKLTTLPSSRNPTPVRRGFDEKSEKKSSLVGLIDSIENRITLKYSDGTFYRITIPLITCSALVEHCLNALKQCLPKDAALVLSCRWYSTRNIIGNDKIEVFEEWDIFTKVLLELLGYEDDHLFEKPNTPAAVKRPKTTQSISDSDWFNLVKNHNNINDTLSQFLDFPLYSTDLSSSSLKSSQTATINPNSTLFPFIRLIHFTLHLLYEDFKLNVSYVENLLPIAKLLSKLANDLGEKAYSLHYWKDFSKHVSCETTKIDENLFKYINNNSFGNLQENPPNIMEHIYKLIKGEVILPYPYCMSVNNRSKDIIQLCGALFKIYKNIPNICESFIKNVSLSNYFVNNTKISECSTIEQFVLLMVDMKINTRYLETLPIGIYFLFCNALWKCRENPPSDWPLEAYRLICRDDLVAQAKKLEIEKDKLFQEKMNICCQLQETMPNTKQEIADLDGMEDIDCSLTKIRFSEDIRVAEARKMLASSKPVPITLIQRPDISDHDFIDEQEKDLYGICIRTMALPIGRGMMTLRTATPIITEPLPAPALCLSGKAYPRGNTVELIHIDTPTNMNLWPIFHNGIANGLRITPDAQNIDNTWITFNKPKAGDEAKMEHAGFLMALGLNGHLKNLLMVTTFEYLSSDQKHEMTNVGILLGLTANYRGTCNHFLTTLLAIHTETLLPPTSMELDVFHNLQVAGLLGIGLLYQKSAHRHMTEVLLSEIGRPPGPEMENSMDRESYSLAAGLALGMVMLKYGDQSPGMPDLNVADTLHYYMIGGNKRPLTGSQKEKYKTASFQIREGSCVNLDVTAPGATLAIGLMYLGSGNKAVANWMSPPETQYLLDFVRPDFLMLRTLSRSLILWDNIEPSTEWVINEVPSTIRPYCMVTPNNDEDIDYEAMNQAYCNIIAGACFAIGLKFAGSADQDAFETLLYFCHMFTSITNKSIAELAGKATIETCLNVLLISASMIMAGTGNLEVMRLVRHLRRRVGLPNSAIVHYGSHLAIHMALGLLFLGGGRYTLSNSPASVAALICAFYPKFPTHSNDNRYHLQAFRHLYVLAAEPRLVIPKDVISNDICYAKLRVFKLNGDELILKGPGLLPDINSLRKIKVDDERYWPVVFERGRNWDLLMKILNSTGFIEVKQRAGCLSYINDKFGHHSELAKTLMHSSVIPWDPAFSSIINFTSDDSIKKFCEIVLNIEKNTSSHFEQRIIQLLTRATYDAVIKDKIIVVIIMTSLLKIIMNLQSLKNEYRELWQLKIIVQQILSNSPKPDIISKETIVALQQEIFGFFERYEEKIKENLKKYLMGETFNSTDHILAAYVNYYDIPNNLPNPGRKIESLEIASHMRNYNYSDQTILRILRICQ